MYRWSTPRPFLKWAGGKKQLLEPILAKLPKAIATYHEPFVGGGAVFFELAKEGRFERAVLSDSNEDLIECYRAIQCHVDELIEALKAYRHSEEDYYRVRASRPARRAERAARIIYLNKTGFNGLYRVNRSGEFNVPFGRYKNPTICDEPNLRAVSEALANVELQVSDFERAAASAKPGDAVYFDPPYLPISKTSYFTAYDRGSFGISEHERLAQVFADMTRRGVPAVLSNSDTPETRELYRDFDLATVLATRAINSKVDGRGAISEILVTNEPSLRKQRRKAKKSQRAVTSSSS
jgi:DNA adenine methylase